MICGGENMEKVKIVVNEMPKSATNCPFAIEGGNDYPCVCDLKRDKVSDNQFGISFSFTQKCNCKLSKNQKCDMLITLKEKNEPKKIIQTVENGKMKRVFSCCGKDCTQMTSWITLSFCPYCGQAIDCH